MFSGVLTDTAALFDTNVGTVALTFSPSFLLFSDAILRVFLQELHCIQNNYFSLQNVGAPKFVGSLFRRVV